MDVREAATDDEVSAALALRSQVFCEEQGVSFEADQDGRDPEATHIVAVDDGAVIGTCRLLFRGHVARLGRLAVARERRGDGVAAAILPGVDIAGGWGALAVAAVVAVLNAILPPILAALRLPFMIALGFLLVLALNAPTFA